MAHHQLSLPYDVITPDYIPMQPHESLAHYAKRFGDYLQDRSMLDINRPVFLSGYSFGSAIVQELSQAIPSKGLILLGGLRSSDEIKPFIRFFGRYVSSRLPLPIYNIAEVFVPPAMRLISGIQPSDIRLARRMYHDLPAGLFRAGFEALTEWKGCPVRIPLLRIHGEKDQIITCPSPGENVIVVKRAKHLVGQANPAIVNAAIERFITDVLRLD